MSSGQLKIDLSGLEAGTTTQQGELDVVVLDAAGEDEPHHVRVACELDVQGRRIHLRAQVRGRARSHCHRCLNEFGRPVETGFDLVLQRGGESPGEDVVVLADTALEYDLTQHVREAVILEEPIQLVCRADCKGLCSQCGQDRNVASCSCAPPADARWEALKKLSDELER